MACPLSVCINRIPPYMEVALSGFLSPGNPPVPEPLIRSYISLGLRTSYSHHAAAINPDMVPGPN